MSGQGVADQNGHRPQQVVHVRENSDSAMDELFNVLKTSNKAPGSSYKSKNLPPSFFNPPDPNRHSRENSQDNTFIPGHHPGLIPNHGRSRSSPAQLPNTLSMPTPAPNHRPQHSVDLIDDMQMPAGWDRRNFFNSQNSQTAQWQQQQQQTSPVQHVQKSQSSGNLVEPLSPASSHGPSPAVSQHNVSLDMRLPSGWDISVTGDMEVYFINHLSKTTSWYHPSIPKHQQGPGPIKLSQLPPTQQQQILQTSQAQQQAAAAAQQQQQQQPLPIQQPSPQQQQQLSPNVAPPQHQQKLPPQLVPGMAPAPPASSGQNERNIVLELQRLQKEKERLQREQEEIARKELILKDLMSPVPMDSGLPPAAMQTSSGVDPFLGSESHARQNSADSGLGGMGNSYSLPRTPEDFLSNVDEMDSSELGQKLLKSGLGSDFNMNDMHGSTSMDIALDGDNSTAMGGDDLVSSLQDDMLNSDLLSDIDMINQAVSPTTWL